MKKFFSQSSLIILISIAAAIIFNQFSPDPVNIFAGYTPPIKKAAIEFNTVETEQVKDLVASGMAILIDARKQEMFVKGHIPGAISLPIEDFDREYANKKKYLNQKKLIIVYCIGNNCTDSQLLCERLHQIGYEDIFIYKEGLEGWTNRGNEVAGIKENER